MSRIEIMHGVNLGVLGRRSSEHYGTLTLVELEARVRRFALELRLEPSFSQTDHEGEFCENLHEAADIANGLVLNPGAWTHYSYAIRDALEATGLPAVEVHLSAVDQREEWRRVSVIRELCVGTVQGKGVDGYREALELLTARLER